MRGFRFVSLLAAAAFAHDACGQDLTPRAAPQQRDVILENATLHPVALPPIEGGALWFRAGRIHAIQRGRIEVPAGAASEPERIDLRGRHVYPGLIGAVSQVGLIEIDQVRATVDTAETGSFTPEVRALVAVNPDSTVLPVTRSNGVLASGVFPLGGVVPGRASVIQLEGWTWEEMRVADDAGLVVNWPGVRPPPRFSWALDQRRVEDEEGRIRESLRNLDEAFDSAQAYLAARAADPRLPVDVRKEAYGPTLRGAKPLFVRAQEVEQIQSAVAFAVRRGFRLVLVGARDAGRCLDLLRRHEVAVILEGTHVMPPRRDADYDEIFRLPAALEAAGIRWCLASGEEFYNERNLPYQAATAVAFGLSKEAALRAVTLSAAELLGVADRLGSLEAGKDATLIVTNGDPLEYATRIEHAWIAGRKLDLRNKQTELARRYRERYRK
ncbi:MAG: amidohydrolase family protein [Planctomycetes bacterium]|nr:amidohydrolase family protein [Planctomycetota bacterium]